MTDNRAAERTCYRCDDPLTDTYVIRLSATHETDIAHQYRDVERDVCLDCLAAIGLLEINRAIDPEPDEAPTTSTSNPLRTFFAE